MSAVLSAARAAAVAINSYDTGHLADARKAAKDHTTGDLLDHLDKAYDLLDQQSSKNHTLQRTTVDHVGLIVLGPKAVKADVLVSGTLQTARADVNVQNKRFIKMISMVKDHGLWRASAQGAPDGVQDAPRGNSALHDAFAAAKAHLPAMYTYRHDHFDEDYTKLLGYTTADAYTALSSRRNAIEGQMQKLQTDSKGSLQALSVVSATGNSVEVFALVDAGTRFHGVEGAVRHWQVDATLVPADQHWLISQFTADPAA